MLTAAYELVSGTGILCTIRVCGACKWDIQSYSEILLLSTEKCLQCEEHSVKWDHVDRSSRALSLCFYIMLVRRHIGRNEQDCEIFPRSKRVSN